MELNVVGLQKIQSVVSFHFMGVVESERYIFRLREVDNEIELYVVQLLLERRIFFS